MGLPEQEGAVWTPTQLPSKSTHDCHADFLTRLKLLLINARSIKNMIILIHDLILDEDVDLACISETWVGAEDDVALCFMSSPPQPQVSGYGTSWGWRNRYLCHCGLYIYHSTNHETCSVAVGSGMPTFCWVTVTGWHCYWCTIPLAAQYSPCWGWPYSSRTQGWRPPNFQFWVNSTFTLRLWRISWFRSSWAP